MSVEDFDLTDPIQARLERLRQLRAAGIEPYQRHYTRTHTVAAVRDAYDHIAPGEETDAVVSLAGRVMSLRHHGGAAFADLRDGSGHLQLFATMDALGERRFDDFLQLDVGDIIGVGGDVIRTRRGELSIRVKSFELLTKSLRPLPEKWHGLRDIEQRFRQRYVDLLVNEDTRRIALIRVELLRAIRSYFDERGFLEVETPMLHVVPTGAAARPFVTHHNALDMDLFLRIAPELHLKRLIVAGFEKVYELNRSFRNEGMSYKHNPEFTMLEVYQAFADYREMMELTEDLLRSVVSGVTGSTKVEHDGTAIDLDAPFERRRFLDLVAEHTGETLDFDTPLETLRTQADRYGCAVKPYYGKGKLLTEIFEKAVEASLVGPVFVYDYPEETSPLARRTTDSADLVERFELIIAGREIANAFSELTDPHDQDRRFREQAHLKELGEEEVQGYDADFIRALEYGLPPTGGLGIGIDRVVMLLAGVHSIREVLLFPHMRPEE